MKNSTFHLFQWIRKALWDTPLGNPVITDDVFESVVDKALHHLIQGLMFSVVIDRQQIANKLTKFKALQALETIHAQNDKLNRLVADVSSRLQRLNVDHVVVKGQVTAAYYPFPRTRIVGDIDIYIAPADQPRMQEIIKQEFGIDMQPFNHGKHTEIELEGVTIEFHRRLNDFHAPWHRRRWSEIMEVEMKDKYIVNIDGVDVPTLNPTMNILYTFIHFYYHLITLGCGLRQLIDLAVLMNVFQKECDAKKLKNYLHSLGLYNAFCAIGRIMGRYIGLPRESFPFKINKFHKRYETIIMKEVMTGGNFGKNKKRKTTDAGIKHTIETYNIMKRNAFRVFFLSPVEVLFLVPQKIHLRLLNFFAPIK